MVPRSSERERAGCFPASGIDIREYITDMPECLAAADLVICRAGAITLSELQAQAPGHFDSFPNVAENHQYHNAMAMVKREAAVILEEKDLTGEALCMTVKKLFEKASRREKENNKVQKWPLQMLTNVFTAF